MSSRYPVVFIGAGPGDPELITVKGLKALANAEVILYAGSLVPQALLGWARREAEIIDTASLDLQAIVARLIEAHRAGKRVVRVHSGDLSIYSAIQEQLEELDRADVPYQLIPGVTAAAAVSAVLAQEFTLPEVTQTVILTRTSGRTPVPAGETLEKLAQHGATLVIYLSVQMIDSIVEQLTPAYGPDAPVVVGYRISWPDEKMVRGTLATIASQVRQAGITRQALILVGPALAASGRSSSRRSKLYDKTFSHGYRTGAAD